MENTDRGQTRVDTAIEVLLEKHVFALTGGTGASDPDQDSDQDENTEQARIGISKVVLGDTVLFSGPAHGKHVRNIDAYVPRYEIGLDAARLKTLKARFAAVRKLRMPQGPQVVPAVPATIPESQQILTLVACTERYLGEEAVPASPMERLQHFRGLLAALSEMHRNGLVHGNIHEGSIRRENVTEAPRLCDLALQTGKGTVLPKEALLYHSAALRSSMEPSVASDIYAMGMLGCRMLIGADGPKIALTGSATAISDDALDAALSRGPVRPLKADQFFGLPEEGPGQKVAAVLSRMLNAPSCKPFATVDEVISALSGSDMGHDTEGPRAVAGPPATWSRLSAGVAAGLGIVALGLGVGVWMTSQTARGLETSLAANRQELRTTAGDLEQTRRALAESQAAGTEMSAEIASLGEIRAALELSLDSCASDLSHLMTDRVAAALIRPALQKAQAAVERASETSLAELSDACLARREVLALLPAANAVQLARDELAQKLGTADQLALLGASVAPVDTASARALLQQTAVFDDSVTPPQLAAAAEALRGRAASLDKTVSARLEAGQALAARLRAAFAEPGDGIAAFLPAPPPQDMPQIAGLALEGDRLLTAYNGAAQALSANLGLEGDSAAPATDLRALPGQLEALRTQSGLALEEKTRQVAELQQVSAGIDSAGQGALELALALLDEAGRTPALLRRNALLEQSAQVFKGAIGAARYDLVADRTALAQRHDALLDTGLSETDEEAAAQLAAVAEDLGQMDSLIAAGQLQAARDLVPGVEQALDAVDAGIAATEGRLAEALALQARLREQVGRAELAALLPDLDLSVWLADPEAGAPAADRLAALQERNGALSDALLEGRRTVARAETRARDLLQKLEAGDGNAAVDRLLAAKAAENEGRLLTAARGFDSAAALAEELIGARSAERSVALGFSDSELAQVRAGCGEECPTLLQGAGARSATVRPFTLDRQEATFGEVLQVFARIGHVPDGARGTYVRTSFDTLRPLGKPMEEQARLYGDGQVAMGLSARDALAYCQAQGKTLPSEADWEYAASGYGERRFPWRSDSPDRPASLSELPTRGRVDPSVARGKSVNPEGYAGFAGGAREWVSTPEGYVLKGGSVRSTLWLDLSVAARIRAEVGIAGEDFGVRCKTELEYWP